MTVNSIPQPSQPIAGGQRIDPTWYRWLRELDREARDTGTDLAAEIEAIARKLGSPDGTIDGIPVQNSAITGLFPISVTDGRVALATIPADVAGDLFGLTTDQWGRITAMRPVIAGDGIEIDGTTDPDEIALVNLNPNVLTTLGDLVRANVDGDPERLPVGTNGQVLTVVDGEPEWATPSGGGGAVPVQDEGTTVVATPTAINFVGAGVTVTDVGGVATVTIPGGGGGGTIDVEDEGSPIVSASVVNFTGAGVTVTDVGGVATVTIPGGGGGSSAKIIGEVARIEARPVPSGGSWSMQGTVTAPTVVGGAAALPITSTNALTARPAVQYSQGSPSTTNVVGIRLQNISVFLGSGTSGGFKFAGGWYMADGATNSSYRNFYGIRASTAAPTDANPSTLINCIGFGCDAADTTIHFFHNDATGTATKVNTGIAKPLTNNSEGFIVRISSEAGSGVVNYYIRALVSGTEFSGSASSDLPSATTLLINNSYASVGGVSSAIAANFLSFAFEI